MAAIAKLIIVAGIVFAAFVAGQIVRLRMTRHHERTLMPFKSLAQRGYLYSQEPQVAKKFQAETPKGMKLPAHAKKTRKPTLYG